jgi:hypothetical protein
MKRLEKEIHRVDAAQKAQIKELERAGDADDPATDAWRERIRERFAELAAERKTYTSQLEGLTGQGTGPQQDPRLLDTMPTLPGRLQDIKTATRARLYQAFDLQLLYNEMNQVTIYATITTSTPHTVAAVINDSEPPTPPARYPFPLASSSAIGSSSALRSTRLAAARDDQDRQGTP